MLKVTNGDPFELFRGYSRMHDQAKMDTPVVLSVPPVIEDGTIRSSVEVFVVERAADSTCCLVSFHRVHEYHPLCIRSSAELIDHGTVGAGAGIPTLPDLSGER